MITTLETNEFIYCLQIPSICRANLVSNENKTDKFRFSNEFEKYER